MESDEADISMSTDCTSAVCIEPFNTTPDTCTSATVTLSADIDSNIEPVCATADPLSEDVEDEFEEFCRFAFPEPENISAETSSSSSDPFYFESDHVALKSNDDYRRLLRAFVLLESQRKSALKDLDALLELQQEALNDPLEFATQLTRGNFKKRVPKPASVAELPAIAWERYTDDVESVLASLGGATQSTRQKQKRELMLGIRYSSVPVPTETVSVPTTSTDDKSCIFQLQRPATFNQQWSTDEQRHLEKLLLKYPPERFEARRFAKVAAELPGRTTSQVTSRVQKYFIKLAKAGLPVPGRVPNLSAHGGRWFNGRFHGRQRHGQFYYPPSTFLTSYAPPVYMSDDDTNDDYDGMDFKNVLNADGTTPCASRSSSVGAERLSDDDDDDVPIHLRNTAEYRELKVLSALRRGRATFSEQSAVPTSSFTHQKSSSSSLLDRGTDVHRTVGSHIIDPDYTSESTGVSSYLDPNYMPAV